ncbi:MAG TPA: LysR family transcriptional regulator [Vicinamibacteria bacterium]|nr:LysR family transcriptional regulator [Vicinamibacteria bacterium]
MNLRHLTTFQDIVKAGSFSRAARSLGCSQSTVTLHVQALEAELGVALFHRRGRRTSLTEAGETLAARCGGVLDGLASLKRTLQELAAGNAGELRLASIEPLASLRVLPRLAEFCRTRPRLSVRLEIGGTGSVSRAVADGRVDFGLASLPAPELRLAFTPLLVERMAVLLPRRHRLARARQVRVRDLAGERLLLTEHGCAYRQATEVALRAAGTPVACSMEIGSLTGLGRAVGAGLGLAIMPRAWLEPPPAGTLARDLTGAEIGLRVGLLQRSDGPPPPPAAASFLELLLKQPLEA